MYLAILRSTQHIKIKSLHLRYAAAEGGKIAKTCHTTEYIGNVCDGQRNEIIC